METYIPIRTGAAGAIQGVFEIYTDMSALVLRNERAVFTILAGVGLVLALLYGALVLVVRRARDVIESQQRIISERSAALETLSAQMLSGAEMEKRKLAVGLHEGIAQTLAAIRIRLEHSLERIAGRDREVEPLASVIPVLQEAIEQVKAIATGLRPSSLDELGLLPTIDWLCREFARRHPQIRVAQDISLEEEDTPGPLKIVIYRIIESVLRDSEGAENTERIVLCLRLAEGTLSLAVEETPRDSRYASASARGAHADLQLQFAEAKERTTLSGGTFSASRDKAGGVTLRASWKA
jgi:signal transduction histidine kinase